MRDAVSRAAVFTAAFFFGALAVSAAAHAAARLAANPVQLAVPAKALAASTTITNRGKAAVTVQAELLEWTQAPAGERKIPTRDLLVSPVVFRLEPGASQVVRVGRLKAVEPPAQEKAYRLQVNEVPPAGAAATPGMIATVLQLSFPVFVPAAEPAPPALQWTGTRENADDLSLRVKNPANTHAKVTRLSLVQDGSVIAERQLNYYVLANAERELKWPGALRQAKAANVVLRAQLGLRRVVEHALTVAPAAGNEK